LLEDQVPIRRLEMQLPMARPLLCLAAVLLLLVAGPEPPAAQEQGLPSGGTDAPGAAPAEGATEREVSAELDREDDRAIAERLRATFAGSRLCAASG
jgi:hypothetical protein